MKNRLFINFLSRDQFWPSGILADKPPERDASVRNITQVLCKAKLLGIVSGKRKPISFSNQNCSISDELRHIIGSETTRRGLLRLFELLQNETLNRRFVYIVIEALLIKLFRPNDLHLIFEKLYSQSDRVKEEYRRRIFEKIRLIMAILIVNNISMIQINVPIISIVYPYEQMTIMRVYHVRIVLHNKNHLQEVYRKSLR